MSTAPPGITPWVRRHPLAAFFVGAYVFSWVLWLPAVLGFDEGFGVALFFLGVFGPATSAAVVVGLTGGSPREWLRSVLRVRFGLRWVAYAIGVPVGVVVVASLAFALTGEDLDFSLVEERLVSFLPVLAFTFLLNGGPEEPGWRGFALPRLEERLAPVRATLLLGILWAFWHLPLLAVEDDPSHGLGTWAFAGVIVLTVLGIVLYAFPYTFLWNRTGSALACMLLHAGFNTAIALVVLRPASALEEGTYVVLQVSLDATLLALALALVVATGGRLGRPER